ncbi:MarC family protein [Paenibacillus sp. TAF58]
MDLYTSFLLLSLTSFFTLINPLAIMPIFMSMTADLEAQKKVYTARKAVIVSFFTLLIFSTTGEWVFHFFNISINSLKIVGGVIFILMGQDMLQARLVRTKVDKADVDTYVNDISITPLAIPMICGPGAITNGIVLMESTTNFMEKIILIVVIAVVLLLTYIVLVHSTAIYRWIGPTGNNVLMRLMGLIVMVIAIEFMVSGITPIIRQILKISP